MTSPVLRSAAEADLSAIVDLLADDPLGRLREKPGDPAYAAAFAAIEADPNQLLAVADRDGEIVGTLQLTFIPGLSHAGATRAQLEAVRVRADERGNGLGGEMVRWAVAQARGRGARILQLTSSNSRERAHRFYERLGFERSHVGMKLDLTG
ncbi:MULTISPECIES: GNAT family N-acetyltransferase [unclassified Saccharopolyspora]|uniref:GNAT family N-acetyltransferase n=1 Tax=unclassified Saccharopolyspora TaxID=2646250 RepID=UPI001CD430D0|nr:MULTISPECIES: GNAT family N-acetyltransferase [unclassified Saccharopolyspora]MCA1187778.1 GNAT family N-acetyltransferase [Saccharopolyspora sp. 6T]MCA1227643.1 GNAT family N-acetyltransferase [Saccharopolyspora sp. 6M]MCA1279844.1 GNAT family N-acetyltransferase [Saccharopolyspora sp. 7B]